MVVVKVVDHDVLDKVDTQCGNNWHSIAVLLGLVTDWLKFHSSFRPYFQKTGAVNPNFYVFHVYETFKVS